MVGRAEGTLVVGRTIYRISVETIDLPCAELDRGTER